MPKVNKRSGGFEDWNKEKIINSATKAGVTLKSAVAISEILEEWASENAQDGVILSAEIKDKLIEVLKLINPIAAETYATYKK